MENLQAIQALIKAVEQAEGPDPEIDAEIWLTFTPGATRKKWSYVHIASNKECSVDETREASGRLIIVPAFTSSIDEALKLVRRDYPGIGIILQSGYRGPYSCCTLRKQDSAAFTTGSMIGQVERPDDEMALAIVGAYLMAKEGEVENAEVAEGDAHAA